MSIFKDAVDKTKKKAAELIENARIAAEKKEAEDRKRREEKERLFKESFPHKFMLSIWENAIFSTKEVDWAKQMKCSFVMTNIDDIPVYVSWEDAWLGRDKQIVLNSQKEIIGYVRKHFFNLGFPFVKERRGCTVKIAETKEKFRFTTYLSFGDREFGGTGTITGETVYELNGVGKNKDTKEFKVKKGKKNIIHIFNGSPNDGFLVKRYIVGYDNEADEKLAVLCGLAVRMIME